MTAANSMLDRALQDMPQCLAAGIVELDSGSLLHVRTAQPLKHLDFVAAVTLDLFEGSPVVAIEDMFKRVRGVENTGHYFQEILVTAPRLIHYFGRVNCNERLVFVAVCQATTNLGLILAEGRTLTRSEQLMAH